MEAQREGSSPEIVQTTCELPVVFLVSRLWPFGICVVFAWVLTFLFCSELAAVLLRNRDALVAMRTRLVGEMRGSTVFDGEGWADTFRTLVRMSMETASAEGGARPHHNIIAAIR